MSKSYHENCIFCQSWTEKNLWPGRSVKKMHFRRENSNSTFFRLSLLLFSEASYTFFILARKLLLFRFLVIFLDFESLSCSSIVELEIVYIKQKLWFRSWWIEQGAYWEKLGPTNQSIMMKSMHNMLLLLFPMLLVNDRTSILLVRPNWCRSMT